WTHRTGRTPGMISPWTMRRRRAWSHDAPRNGSPSMPSVRRRPTSTAGSKAPIAAAGTKMGVERLSKTWVNVVHGRNILYNQCMEDPRVDGVALKLTDQDRVVVITSAGCNALDYALAGAGHVHAVDMNSRQNALLELKLAGARSLEYEDFFSLFGGGR